MSTQREYTVEDFKAIEIKESWTSFDVLVAVCVEAEKMESLNRVKESSTIDEKNNPVKKIRFLCNPQRTEIIKKRKRVSEASRENKRSRDIVPNDAHLPEVVKKIIKELRQGKNQTGDNITEPLLVIQKTLFTTDVSKGHNRLSIPMKQMSCACTDFLTEEERGFLAGRLEDNHKKSIDVKIIEPLLKVGNAKLAKWDMKKEDGKISESYVLNGTWKDIAKRNNLKRGRNVQLWAFRVEEKLCFALVKLPKNRTRRGAA